jgi:thiamine phosphate synthase YjbQ (UPF0047 family)
MMSEITIEIAPKQRLDVIDVRRLVADQVEGFSSRFRNALYCSYHTTAGFLDEHYLNRLENRRDTVETYLSTIGKLFPPDAGYRHDQMDLRSELSLEQRRVEPRNADSHLTFISAGLRNCAVYRNDSQRPVFFIDLDGVNGSVSRARKATVLGFNKEIIANSFELSVPVSRHAVDSVNLNDPNLGIIDEINEHIRRSGVQKGRVELDIESCERNVGITVNEYETLLMRHDLADVLQNPIRFMREKGRNMLRDPRAIPSKAKNYAKYDFVQVLNEALDMLGMSESIVERAIDRLMAMPAERFFGMKRGVTMFVNGAEGSDPGRVVFGRYQSPILVQWARPASRRRNLRVTLYALE